MCVFNLLVLQDPGCANLADWFQAFADVLAGGGGGSRQQQDEAAAMAALEQH